MREILPVTRREKSWKKSWKKAIDFPKTAVKVFKPHNCMQTPPAVREVIIDNEVLGFHLEDGRFISVPIDFYPTLALATPEERIRFEIHGSSVFWPDLDADIGTEGLLAGAREHHYYARKAVERAVRLGRLSASALESCTPATPTDPSPMVSTHGVAKQLRSI